MKKFIKENWFKIVVLLVLLGLFYWYEWRPNKIIKQCSLNALDRAKIIKNSDREDYEYFYRKCLRENGLEIGVKANWK
ncbi:MAG: hypothetical protein KAQ64_02495 [Candidatus Pacebacteria bacterium]|nr:hypothetical protein [Candidatus Paceibacterota bacterium]